MFATHSTTNIADLPPTFFLFIFQNRRSWLDESRLTQSQFSIAFDSAGNESDNSAEDPSITPDKSQSKKDTIAHLTAQRKAMEDVMNRVSPSNSTYQPLIRDDAIRSSRTALTGYVQF